MSTRQTLAALVTSVGLLGLAGGCGKAPLGQTCNEADECAEGLSCLQSNEYDPASSSCKAADKFCTIPCASDAECTATLGAGHICVGASNSRTACSGVGGSKRILWLNRRSEA